MGMQLSFTTDSGIPITDGYFRIKSLGGNQESISFELIGYASRTAYLNGFSEVSKKTYTYQPNLLYKSDNLFRQAYEYLKTLPGFEKSEDIFEEGQTS